MDCFWNFNYVLWTNYWGEICNATQDWGNLTLGEDAFLKNNILEADDHVDKQVAYRGW